MHTVGSDDSGPRIDMGDFGQDEASPRAGYSAPAPVNSAPKGGGGFAKAASLAALLLSLVALAVSLWGGFSPAPETMPARTQNEPQVTPGAAAAAERVRKLEQDVQNLMLSLNDLQGEVAAIRSKAGAVSKLTELTAKVAALQSRLERMDEAAYENAVKSLAKGKNTPAPATPKPVVKPAPKPQAKPEKAVVKEKQKPQPQAKPKKKKHVYTIKRGESLFAIAARYKVSVNDLKKWNELKSTSKIFAGQKLVIWLDR